VGLEDHAGPGEPSNADLLRALLDLLRDMGREPATIARTRAILGVPARAANLWGRTFVGDAPHGLGDGTPVTITFAAPDGIAVHAGGNRLGFRATTTADRLTVDERVRSTRMACPPDVAGPRRLAGRPAHRRSRLDARRAVPDPRRRELTDRSRGERRTALALAPWCCARGRS
jgi:hypothetical protein